MDSEEVIRQLREELDAKTEANILLNQTVDRLTSRNADLGRKNTVLRNKMDGLRVKNEVVKQILDEKVVALAQSQEFLKRKGDLLNSTVNAKKLLEAESDLLKKENEKLKKEVKSAEARMAKPCCQCQPTQIFIRDLNGKPFAMHVKNCDTIEEVKRMVEKKTTVPTRYQRIIYCGKQLDDVRTVAEYGIQKDSTLHLVFRLLSCGGSGSGCPCSH